MIIQWGSAVCFHGTLNKPGDHYLMP